MKKIAVLISGQGSNLQAIIEACQTCFIPGKIVTVISNKIDSFG
ncbi:formyltransferase family protein, partial [uncultured Haemophilus sp.]